MRTGSAASIRFESLLGTAHELADRSADATLPYFRKRVTVDNKAKGGDFDPVTAADRKAEKVISKLIRETYPDHGLVGEEFGNHREDARYRWVIDPIDGTRSFIMGTPLWGTLIGLMDGDAALLGMMDQPFTGERFWSGEKVAFSRTRSGKPQRLKTRPCAHLSDAVLTTTHPDLFTRGLEVDSFGQLRKSARMTRYGGDCYTYCLLAAGFVDLIVESGLKTYDVVALIPIIERAGGRITTWDGKPAINGGRIVAAGDPKLHEIALKVLKG